MHLCRTPPTTKLQHNDFQIEDRKTRTTLTPSASKAAKPFPDLRSKITRTTPTAASLSHER